MYLWLKTIDMASRFDLRAARNVLSSCVLAFAFAAFTSAVANAAPKRPLSITDVLRISRVERVAASPDGAMVAIVVSRPATKGEVFGRTYYETDPSRNDIWVVSRKTGERRDLTRGAGLAGGSWCPAWSPDGGRLAFLSTAPVEGEPRGGDNVRLHVWNVRSDEITRAGGGAVMTQTHYGSPMYRLDLRGGADRRTSAHPCSAEENAPFLWLDDHRLLLLGLPAATVSGLLDEQARVDRSQVETMTALRDGQIATASAVGSGEAVGTRGGESALLRIADLDAATTSEIAAVPVYPFRGETTISLAPDGRTAAVLATVGSLKPVGGRPYPNATDDTWTVGKRFGVVDLGRPNGIDWIAAPPAGRLPLELYGWSPGGRSLMLRARSEVMDDAASLFRYDLDLRGGMSEVAAGCTVGDRRAGQSAHEPAAIWTARTAILMRARCAGGVGGTRGGGRAEWWLVREGAAPVALTRDPAEVPSAFRAASDGSLYAIADGGTVILDEAAGRLSTVPTDLPRGTDVTWPSDGDDGSGRTLVSTATDARRRAILLDAAEPTRIRSNVPLGDRDEVVGVAGRSLLVRRQDFAGLSIREIDPAGSARTLFEADEHLKEVRWGVSTTVSYRGADGQELSAAVILPPGHDASRRYPVLTWVYPGMSRNAFGYWLDPFMPGIYNLQLYAARGYIVLIPEMPLKRSGSRNDMFLDITKGVVPAVDLLVSRGWADPDRVGVMGQSMGGYAVYALVTQTTRFKAAVAVAGLTDFSSFATSFDPTARGYPAIEHERSYNWNILSYGDHATIAEDRSNYLRESPIEYVDRVRTPLLMLHGERDARAPLSQAEAFFYRLYRQGATARLVRYWGENHAIARSPANVRDAFERAVEWFDRWMPEGGGADALASKTRKVETPQP